MIDGQGIAGRVIAVLEQMNAVRRPSVVPSLNALAAAFEQVFWSSLDHYEGAPLRARVFFTTLETVTNSPSIIRLQELIVFSSSTIRQLAPAHAADGGLLVVEDASGRLFVAGILSSFPSVHGAKPWWISIESRNTGVVRVSSGSSPILEFTRGDVRQLGGMAFDRTSAEVLLMTANLFPTEPTGLSWEIAAAILDIAFAIERAGDGGALWILPATLSASSEVDGLGHGVSMRPESWEPYRESWERRTSVIRLLNPGCDAGHEFLQAAAQEWDALRRLALINSIASLAGVDGAVVVDGSPRVLEFGVICNKFRKPAERVRKLTNPSNLLAGEDVDASHFGGSRHRSAIDFCSSSSPAGAVVASHDGGLTVFVSTSIGDVIGSKISLIRSDAEVQ